MNTTHWPEGIKKTKQREAIWSVLNSTDKPITAIEIAERLGDGSTTWMSTIYRTLELLKQKISLHVPPSWVATWRTTKLHPIRTVTMRYVRNVEL